MLDFNICPTFDEYYGLEIDATIHCREPKCNGVLIAEDVFMPLPGLVAVALVCSECDAGFGITISITGGKS